MNLESHAVLLTRVGVVMVYITVWLVTRYFYRKHKPEIIHAVEDGRAQQSQVVEESKWFHKSTLWLSILALIATFIPISWWLVGYIALTTLAYVCIASFNESMLLSSVRRAEYEPN